MRNALTTFAAILTIIAVSILVLAVTGIAGAIIAKSFTWFYNLLP